MRPSKCICSLHDRHKSLCPHPVTSLDSHLLCYDISLLICMYCMFSLSVSFSDLGLDQFIVKRYDGKVRSGYVCGKEDGLLRGSAGGSFNNYVLETLIYLMCFESCALITVRAYRFSRNNMPVYQRVLFLRMVNIVMAYRTTHPKYKKNIF